MVQTIYDIIKAHGGIISVRTNNCPPGDKKKAETQPTETAAPKSTGIQELNLSSGY